MSTDTRWKNCLISMVVDNLPEHYFKAELLLLSIDRLGGIPMESVLVQCVDRVDQSFKKFVQDKGCCFREISPYLDGTYCNKLQQLDGLSEALTSKDGIFLLDVDMVLIGELDIPSFDKVFGKIVDAPNPPIEVLERIFFTAGMPLPGYVPCDWDLGVTLATNFNGGFLYVPAQLVSEVSSRWRAWAEWLFDRPHLFDTPQQRIHVDQVSMALTLAEGGIPYGQLAANFNFPTHYSDRIPTTFDRAAPLRVLHYHAGLNSFGLIEPASGMPEFINAAIELINDVIVTQGKFRFFDTLKRTQASRLNPATSQPCTLLNNTLNNLSSQHSKRRLILHAGTPKTGTSSLQAFFDKNRKSLLASGLFYPNTNSVEQPKHQWLVSCLLNSDEVSFCDYLKEALSELDSSTHTIFLSTEGLFNHWWDYSATSKSMLAVLANWFEVEVWVWFRDPESFASSLYRQYLVNPSFYLAKCYGQDLTFGEMLDDPWFAKHLDYLGFVREIQSIFGDSAIRPIIYTGDTIGACLSLLGVDVLTDYFTRENASLSQVGVELIRIVNRQNLEGDIKLKVASIVKELDLLLNGGDRPFLLSSEDSHQLRKITALGNAVLKDEFGIYWP